MKRKFLLFSATAAIVVVVVGAIVYVVFVRPTAASVASDNAVSAPAPEVVSVLVKTAPLQRQALDSKITTFGDVLTGKVVTISFPRAGQITRLPLQIGQRLHAGAVLATLSSDPNVQLAFSQASNAVRLARADVQHSTQLFALQLATQSQVDIARKSLQDAEATLTAQKVLGGDVGVASLTAPFDGVVVALSAAQGDRVAAGAALLQFAHIDSLRVQLGIEPSQSRMVKVGMAVALSPLQNPAHIVSGKITEIQDLVDPKTQLVSATVVLPASAANFLVPGMHAQGVIGIDRRQGWAVPRQAVLNDDVGSYLFQVAQGKAHRVEVTKLSEEKETVGVDGKIDESLPVVVLGNYELQDGMAVRMGAP